MVLLLRVVEEFEQPILLSNLLYLLIAFLNNSLRVFTQVAESGGGRLNRNGLLFVRLSELLLETSQCKQLLYPLRRAFVVPDLRGHILVVCWGVWSERETTILCCII